ncbi:hypothetical protein HYC85_029296 [Camellia sinensis]|uniref:Uncharacterized protein n=1 Tax=Camellia sinensis TaxID=4442 RepID=A0A7J7FXQ4_CAMSI|nr:hypothetical protein HYC85_029296 [Camellia sinensis]
MVGLRRAWALPNTIRVGFGQTPNPTEPARVVPLGLTTFIHAVSSQRIFFFFFFLLVKKIFISSGTSITTR